MTENEKKLLQAKHRLEEAEMRDRQKERKARTRRLIQEGAILEKVWCCTIKVDIENSKGQYIEKDKQEATKDGSESTKIQHGI